MTDPRANTTAWAAELVARMDLCCECEHHNYQPEVWCPSRVADALVAAYARGLADAARACDEWASHYRRHEGDPARHYAQQAERDAATIRSNSTPTTPV